MLQNCALAFTPVRYTSVVDFLHDIGTANSYDVSSEGDPRAQFTNPRDGRSFDTPALLGVWATAPYLHDGSAETLEEAIKSHKYSEIETISEIEVFKIAEYLRTLD
ncbi:hypothetical protein [Chengkuizengella sediminis]|uniref:c-type cytochrome n=1 Tax=Chengkuizengella sediminis TaxID=1885917 RepID=UPI001389EFB8|nr:hypothetical protein [Chengkuizengella sediminis]